MARTKGSKDKEKRARRTSTDAEKIRRKEKKARVEQQNMERVRARARETFFHSSVLVDQTPPEPEIQYKEVYANECNGTTDLGEIEASFDDEYDKRDDVANSGVMKDYMKALMKRYAIEDAVDFKRSRPTDTEWLQEFLKNHGYWIRSECAPFLCKKLHIQPHEQAYYRDIRVWFPDVEGGVSCMPMCLTCKSNMNVRPHSYPMCRQQGIPIPFLPVDGKDEYKLFSHLVLFELKHFEENEMAMKWIDFVDGVTIFPKLPHQLRKYHKQWERNRRVQNAVDNMKSELNMLDDLNKEHIPPDLATGESGIDDGMGFHDDDIVDVMEAGGLLTFPRAYLPPPMEPPGIQALRPAYERDGLFVGFDRIGENLILEELPPFMRFQGNRGQDIRKRKVRRCWLCLHYGQSNMARECPGRSHRKNCRRFNEDGSSKNLLAN